MMNLALIIVIISGIIVALRTDNNAGLSCAK